MLWLSRDFAWLRASTSLNSFVYWTFGLAFLTYHCRLVCPDARSSGSNWDWVILHSYVDNVNFRLSYLRMDVSQHCAANLATVERTKTDLRQQRWLKKCFICFTATLLTAIAIFPPRERETIIFYPFCMSKKIGLLLKEPGEYIATQQ